MKRPVIIIVLAVFAAGLIMGSFLFNNPDIKHSHSPERVIENNFYEVRETGYRFVSPLLECSYNVPSRLRQMVGMREEVSIYIQNAQKRHEVQNVSFYYRDLHNGPWIGFNETDLYVPASLLKVPILIAVLKRAEHDKNFLKETVFFTESHSIHYPGILGSQSLKPGRIYTIEALLEYMIVYSDNDAKDVLLYVIGDNVVEKILVEFGLTLENPNLNGDFVSVIEYASFFRILYNATFLSREMSEKALEILSRVEYKGGISKNLPENIVVASKFGERGFLDDDKKQLHDCGIVYLENRPYLLCIMTSGKDTNELNKVISDISEIIFRHVSI